jgi:glyoxylase-like metal-dependent hydrolase (beta-lactamase superfamily II)
MSEKAVAAVPACRESAGMLVYMIKRSGTLKEFPGYHTFPWDEIKKTEAGPPSNAALSRMTTGQLGFDLDRARESGKIKQVTHLGTAPLLDFRPFGRVTHFYLIELEEQIPFEVDTEKIGRGEWNTPAEFVRRYERGEMLVLPAALHLLRMLRHGKASITLSGFDLSGDRENEVPYIEPLAGIYQLIHRSLILPPGHRTNCFIIGDGGGQRLAIDPSPANKKEYRRMANTLKKFGVTHIFITHHHPDHLNRAPRLARDLSLPVIMSPNSHQRLLRKRGRGYFKKIDIKFAREGDRLGHWLGQPVRVYEVPGHDEGQLALAPDTMAWFLAGDLIQGAGTVVIPTREGDMARYFRTLERIIGLNPGVILPSHGQVLGSVESLKKTLVHRKHREAQILHLYQKGVTPRRMVKIIYGNANRLTRWLALENIKSHLKKLHQDQKI